MPTKSRIASEIAVPSSSAAVKDSSMTATKGFVVPAGGGKHLDMTAPSRFAPIPSSSQNGSSLRRSCHLGRAHRDQVAGLLSDETGAPLTLWSALSDRNPLMIEPISDEIVRSQQQLADRFHALGIIPTAIQVADERTTAQNANDSMPSTVACAAAPPAAVSDSRNA
jgi:hypothetical protein